MQNKLIAVATCALVLVLAGCGAIRPRLFTGDRPHVTGQCYCAQNGYMGINNFSKSALEVYPTASALDTKIARTALVGATLGAWVDGDGYINKFNVNQRDRFTPVPHGPNCEPLAVSLTPSSTSTREIADLESFLDGSNDPNVIVALFRLLCGALR